MEATSINRDLVLQELERIVASRAFRGAERARSLLRYVVEQELAEKGDRLKEYTVGVEALGRGETFDPRTDPIVRAEASRLRGRLERYYESEGAHDLIVITLPKGTYVPIFGTRDDGHFSAPVEETEIGGLARRSLDGRAALRYAAAIGVAAVTFAVGLWLGRSRPPSDPVARPPAVFDVTLTSTTALGSEVGADVVISRDGARLAFISTGNDGVPRLRTRALKDANAAELPGTEGARGPFFSPDGRWIGFWAAHKIKKVAVNGGAPVTLCDATDLLGASWGEDDSITANINGRYALWRLSASGGTPRQAADFSAEQVSPRWPQLLPGGNDVLFTAVRSIAADRGTIEILSLRTGKRRRVVTGGTFGRYLTTGLLAYINQGALYVVPFDLSTLSVRGRAVPVLDSIAYSPTFGFAQIDFSATGSVVYRRSAGPSVAVWLDSTGVAEPFVELPGPYIAPQLSPDSRRLAVSTVDGGIFATNFFDWDARQRRAMRAPSAALPDVFAPLWTPDGRYVIAGGTTGMAWMRVGGTPQALLRSVGPQVPWSFTPNADRLAYHEVNMKGPTAFDLWTVPIHTDETGLVAGKPELFLQTDAYEVYPAFSPDGRWIAYSSNESGSWEVYVRHFPDDGTKVQVSHDGGRVPRWSRNGHELFYGTDNQRLMVARYEYQNGAFVPGEPRPWTTLRLTDTGVFPNFDLAPNGRRVLALIPKTALAGERRSHEVTLMLDYFDELRRRAASGAR